MQRVTVALAIAILLPVASLAQTTGVGDNLLTQGEEEAGYKLLFDGETLDGWSGAEGLWEVTDGMIHGSHDGSIEANTFLVSDEEFSDFVLRLSCFVPAGNSGIQYRSSVNEAGRVVGYQADIFNGRYWGCLYDEGGGRGVLVDGWETIKDTVRAEGWNEYEIIAQGTHLVQRLNGVTCVDLEDDALASGVFALQLHRGPAMAAHFKNIRIKPLEENELIPEPNAGVPAGWTGLFTGDGIELFDVVGNAEGFAVAEQGILRSEGGKGGDWLRSKLQYSDFVLNVDYRVSPGGNSGAFIRATSDGAPWETGHECQISNEQPPRDATHCTGTLYGNVAADPRPDETPEVWHRYEIHCVGPLITVVVDDKRTLNVDASEIDSIKDKPLVGYIGLQDSHTAAGGWIEFRNVWVKELKYGE